MLKLPAFKHYQFSDGSTATVFQDDAKFWNFYAIPGSPTVRLISKNDGGEDAEDDDSGDPVFMLIKYLFSDQSREENPDLPRGGGYMVFDSELKVKTRHLKTIEEDLQEYVDRTYNDLKNKPARVRTLAANAIRNDVIGEHWKQKGLQGTPRASSETGFVSTLTVPPSGAPEEPLPAVTPPVKFREPLWVSGKVTMNAPESAGLVNNKVGERPASMLGNFVASFNLDLTPDGATFMQKTLVGEDGSGATDLSPIQVVYELAMRAKLPPARLYIHYNTQEVYHAVQELFHEHPNGCRRDDYYTSETMISTAIEAGLITVKIDMGGVVDDEIEQMMMQQAMNFVQQTLAERLADKEQAPLEEWADADLAESEDEVYRLKRVTEVDMTDFTMTLDFHPTTEYQIAPQGTLATFFHGRTDMDKFVRVVDLNDPFFQTLALQARAFANWQEDDIAFVELEVKYEHGGELKTNTFTFTPEETEPQEWSPSLIDGNREYEYRWRAGFEGREAGKWSKWQKETTRDLNVAVETPGKLAVEVTGAGLDFKDIFNAVLVHLRYEDRLNDVPMAGQSILLSADRPSGTWNRNLFAPFEKPIEYRAEYLLTNGMVVETPWQQTDGPTQNILIAPPDDIDVLNLNILPAGKWSGVVQAIASFVYDDGSYNQDQQFRFTKPDEFKQWNVLLRDPGYRKFKYKVLATFENGDTQETDWFIRESDQAVPIQIKGPPRLDLTLTCPTHDFAGVPLVKIDLQYQDPEGDSENESFTFEKRDDIKYWSHPIREDGPRSYRYRITYFPLDGDPVVRDWQVTEEESLIIPRYEVPKVGAEFKPIFQNFSLTPGVEVTLSYNDAQHGIQETETLFFTEKQSQSWFKVVPDEASRTYDMTVTWYYEDGSQQSSTPVTLEKPTVVLPKAPARVQA
ncbi:hypothetical protein C7271_04750 [filamentous cyanobacterium CCP5]|nr:hypothetical protein C7271_04750 [filamentous cyanobacterium CCP5]